jgi:hypothetical protein
MKTIAYKRKTTIKGSLSDRPDGFFNARVIDEGIAVLLNLIDFLVSVDFFFRDRILFTPL